VIRSFQLTIIGGVIGHARGFFAKNEVIMPGIKSCSGPKDRVGRDKKMLLIRGPKGYNYFSAAQLVEIVKGYLSGSEKPR
jgi:hypothetical protein